MKCQVSRNAETRLSEHRHRVALICHHDALLGEKLLSRWIAHFAEVAGVVVVQEDRSNLQQRLRKEYRRSGIVGLVDVLAFRIYYKLFRSRIDAASLSKEIDASFRRYEECVAYPRLVVADPNQPGVAEFLSSVRPEICVVFCKQLLVKSIYSVPSKGMFVLHPGKCPEYRNSHGCFWAIANGESAKAVATLLRIDAGVDTGPVYGYFGYQHDPSRESHVVIQTRVVIENLDAISRRLLEILAGTATPQSTTDSASAAWGQPRLSAYLRYRHMRKIDDGGV